MISKREMSGRTLPRAVCCLLLAAFVYQPAALLAADDSDTQEQAAFEGAVNRVAPSVVQIETVGGREKVGELLIGTGPTTGLVVDLRGYIISSEFNFANKPASILVRLADGTRKPAKLVATDHSRMLVLLKIDVDKPLAVCEVASQREMRIGQWAIAVGRTFESERPNMAVGILSAVDRIWGKALQTDAAVSPNNYGGPLVDIRGRVMGILVPLSPNATGAVAGMEWYDSGIGFAIPMEHVRRILPRLEKGEDLHPGLAGITLKATNLYTGPAVIAACHPKSPATAGGIKAGDQIVAIDGRPVALAAQAKQAIGRRYAGDKMRFTVLRGKERLDREITLIEKLKPFQHGFLGILPVRVAEEQGVTVRYVYPKSPAATAGIAAGDTLVSLDGKPIRGRVELQEKIGTLEPGTTIEVETRRDDSLRKLRMALASLPETLPATQVPPASDGRKNDDTPASRVGSVSMKTPEYPNEVFGYVPDNTASGSPRGVVVWLHGRGGFDWKKLMTQWKPLCDRHGLILVAPKASNLNQWMPTDVALVDRLLAEVKSNYRVDPARVVVYGQESGGWLAFLSAFRNRDMIRAVAAVEAVPMGSPPENDPTHRLAVYVAWATKSSSAVPIDLSVAAMREMRIPVVVKKLGPTPRYLNGAELAELVRWIDMLDRI
jgi:serine protease Do